MQTIIFTFFALMVGIFEAKQTDNFHAFQIKCGNTWFSIVMKMKDDKLVVGIEGKPEEVKAEFKPEDGEQ